MSYKHEPKVHVLELRPVKNASPGFASTAGSAGKADPADPAEPPEFKSIFGPSIEMLPPASELIVLPDLMSIAAPASIANAEPALMSVEDADSIATVDPELISKVDPV